MSTWCMRRWTTPAVAAGLVALTVLGWPAPAGADPKGGCPLGRICLYSGRGFTGRKLVIDPAARGGDGLGEGQAGPCSALDAPVWSAANRSGPRASMPRYRLVLFRTADCGDRAATVGPEVGRADTGGGRSFELQCIERGGCGRRAPLLR
jgi:hypothetical protein